MEEEKINPDDQSKSKASNKNYYKDIDTYIADSRLALTNSSDPEIEPLLTKKGYTKTIIAAKLVELEDLDKLEANQKKEYGEQYEATDDYADFKSDLHDDYIDHLTLARVAFEDDLAAINTLELSATRRESKDGYVAQGKRFYNGILKDVAYKKAMNDKGVTDVELQAQLDDFTNLITLESVQRKETAEAQAATKKRDAALHTFEHWFTNFKTVAIVALRKSPQLREKLGWKE